MGAELYQQEAVYRATLDHCSSLVKIWDSDIDIIEELHRESGESLVYSAPIALVVIPAIQIALVDLLASKGIKPAGNWNLQDIVH